MENRKITMIDSHLHLQDEAYDEDLEEILERARQAGVQRFCCNGTSPSDWQKLAGISRKHSGVIPSFGVHPWFVNDLPENWLEQLQTYLTEIPSAVGEIGLDRWIDGRDETLQEDIFRQQLNLASELNLPVSIHCLRAWDWLQKVFKEEKLPERILIHAYGGSPELIKPLLDHGCWFSYAGNLLRKEKEKLRSAMKLVPVDRLMLETDSPDIPPPKGLNFNKTIYHNKQLRNEPANLLTILTKTAELLNMQPASLEETLWNNANEFWGDLIKSDGK